MQKIAKETLPTAQLRKLHFKSDIQTNAPIHISPPHVRSAIWNLIDNAIKFTPEGGEVLLKVSETDGMVAISVADNGIGISQEEMPKLFTKFHRATSVTVYDYEGTGIGLYASKIIVEEQGGKISVTSEEGKGSTFTIYLPIASDKT
jgi:signal transduction histidine kinase